jgi:hypothetical protein
MRHTSFYPSWYPRLSFFLSNFNFRGCTRTNYIVPNFPTFFPFDRVPIGHSRVIYTNAHVQLFGVSQFLQGWEQTEFYSSQEYNVPFSLLLSNFSVLGAVILYFIPRIGRQAISRYLCSSFDHNQESRLYNKLFTLYLQNKKKKKKKTKKRKNKMKH